MSKINKKYTFLYNFDEEQRPLIDEVINYIGANNAMIASYGIYGDGSIVSDMNSFWVTDEYYHIAYVAMHFAYYLDTEIPFKEMNDVTVQDSIDWHKKHIDEPEIFQIG